jgi:hypothetical protein
MRTIQSPGVEIIEKDLSLSPVLPAGTNIFMTGFASKGPTDEILQITSVEEFENIYGKPTCPAERYFYFSARQVLNSSQGNLFLSRLPYGNDLGDGYDGSLYGALVYPVIAVAPVTGANIYRNDELISAEFFNKVLTTPSTSALYTTLESELISFTLDQDGIDSYRKISISAYNTLLSAATGLMDSGNSSASAVGLSTYNSLTGYSQYSNTEVTYDLTKDGSTYVLGAPKFFTLNKEQYLAVLDKSAFANSNGNWSNTGDNSAGIDTVADFGKAGLIILNKIQSTINARGEGHYVGICDNVNIEPNSDHDTIRGVSTVTENASAGLASDELVVIPETRLAFALSATKDSGFGRNDRNISQLVERATYQFADAPTRKFDDTLSISFIKLRQSPYAADTVKLDYFPEELLYGSVDSHRQINDKNGGLAKTFYLGNLNQNSPNAIVMINDNISDVNSDGWADNNGVPSKKIRLISHTTETLLTNEFSYDKVGFDIADFEEIIGPSNLFNYGDSLFPVGPYVGNASDNKIIGKMTDKIDRSLRKIENDELFDLDLVAEAGLGTIYATVCANGTQTFDDTQINHGLDLGLQALLKAEYVPPTDDTQDLRANYHAVFSLFENFCSNIRKDCMLVADPLRQIFVRGKNTLVLSDNNKAFSQYIYNSLRNLYSLANSSYATTYGNWVKVNDQYSGINVWVPFSGFAVADMANVDSNFQPWYAPAGFTRGRVGNALAVAITPKQKERDMLYKININPVAFFPNEGINIFGQKTLLRQPSAFDRINVRRLFLYLEKATKKTAKFFIFEPNTFFTRKRIASTLSPIFDRAKNTEGLYEYLIVCDERNNTPDVIDQNELVVDIYIKPVRAAEFILVNFYATRTSTDFNELVG